MTRFHYDTVAVRCLGCGAERVLSKAEAETFTGCSKKCRKIVVNLLNRLMRTKMGSEEEVVILKRLRMPLTKTQ